MKTDLNEPCTQCPFRRQAMPGWLGPWEPNELTRAVKVEPFPCHLTIKKRVPFDHPDAANMQSCAGAAIFLRNQCAIPHVEDIRAHMDRLVTLPHYATTSTTVFQWPHEFIRHHEAAPVKSWFGL